ACGQPQVRAAVLLRAAVSELAGERLTADRAAPLDALVGRGLLDRTRVVAELALVGLAVTALDLEEGRSRALGADLRVLDRGHAVLAGAGVVQQVDPAVAVQALLVDDREAGTADLLRVVRVSAAATTAAAVLAGEVGLAVVGHGLAVDDDLLVGAVEALFVVQVGSGDSARRACRADLRSGADLLALADRLRGQVRVARGPATAVVNLDPLAVAGAAGVGHPGHGAARRRDDRVAGDAGLLPVDGQFGAVPLPRGGRGRVAAVERHLERRGGRGLSGSRRQQGGTCGDRDGSHRGGDPAESHGSPSLEKCGTRRNVGPGIPESSGTRTWSEVDAYGSVRHGDRWYPSQVVIGSTFGPSSGRSLARPFLPR